MSSITKPKYQKEEDRLIFLNEEISRLESLKEAKIKETDEELDKLSGKLTTMKAGIANLDKLLKTKDKELFKKVDMLEDVKKGINEAEEANTEAVVDAEAVLAEKARQEENLDFLKNEYVILEEQSKDLVSENMVMLEKKNSLARELKDMQARIDKMEIDKEEKSSYLDSKEKILETRENNIKELESQLEAKEGEISLMRQDIDNTTEMTSKALRDAEMKLSEVARRTLALEDGEKLFTDKVKELQSREDDIGDRENELKVREENFLILKAKTDSLMRKIQAKKYDK